MNQLLLLALAALAVIAALWVFSRAAIFLIERLSPPGGKLVRAGPYSVHVLDLPAGPDAPVLLLLHGASGNLREPLEALKAALGGRFRLVALDRPGHGYTARCGPEMCDPACQADLVAAVLAELSIGRCLVFGHSWGASVAAALALRHPERVAGLVLVAPATHPWPGSISRRTRFFATPLGRVCAEIVVVPLGLVLARAVVPAIFHPDPVPDRYERRIGALLSLRPTRFVAGCGDVANFYRHLVRLSARYHEIRAPAEIVTGDLDRVVAPAIHSYGLARDIPGARLTVLPGAGHMPHWSRTSDVVAAIERALRRSEGG